MLRSFAVGLSMLLLALGSTPLQAGPFSLATAGCPMAHCDSRLSNGSNTTGPSSGNLASIDSNFEGGKFGLGCASNTRIAACTRHGDPPAPSNLVVYDADGHRIWDDAGVLGATAWMSAPMMGADDTVIAADQNWILRADPVARTMVWKSAKPDTGNPISPVLAGADGSMVLLATNTSDMGGVAELSIWDAATGVLLSHQSIVDPVTGKVYVTRNTPAVSGNRAYVLTEADIDKTDGRLYAIDICTAPDCGGRGVIAVRWHYDFTGPSGASPMLIGSRIFFDGRPTARSGSFMAVQDLGATPSLVWKRLFASKIAANAAQDPRGGLWVYPALTESMLRLHQDTGATVQNIVVSQATALPAGYGASSAVSVSRSLAGATVLTFGIRAFGQDSLPSYVAAIDVSTSSNGAAVWLYQVAPTAAANAAAGQFPVVVSATGARRVVFQGTNSGTFFVGEP